MFIWLRFDDDYLKYYVKSCSSTLAAFDEVAFVAHSKASTIKTFNYLKNLAWMRVLNPYLSKKLFIFNYVEHISSTLNWGEAWLLSTFLIFDLFFSSTIVFSQHKLSFHTFLLECCPFPSNMSKYFEQSSRKLLIIDMCL